MLLAHARFRLCGPAGIFPHQQLEHFLAQGVIGVPIFFGISGLLIGARLLEERALRGTISLRGFYLRRFCRILPPYLLCLAAIALLGALRGVEIATSDLLACLLFVRNYVPGENAASWFTNHFWSLAVEEHFYLLLPGLLVLARPRRAAAILLGASALIAVWRVVQQHPEITSAGTRFLTYRTDLRIDGLLLGALAALALAAPAARARLALLLRPGLVIGGVLALAVAPFVGLPQVELPRWIHGCALQTFVALLVPLLLLGTLLHPRSALGRLLECAPLRWIGRLSYSLYLWQQLFLTPTHAPFTGEPVPQLLPEWMLAWPWCFSGLLLCALASYHWVERPLTRLGRRLAEPATEGRAP